MRAGIDLSDALARDVGIELRGADTRMSEQLLDDPQVGSAFQKMGRERVPKRVRRDTFVETRDPNGSLDDCPRLLSREALAAWRQEEWAAATVIGSGALTEPGRTDGGEVPLDPAEGDLAGRH
jgi:hypothetical protein